MYILHWCEYFICVNIPVSLCANQVLFFTEIIFNQSFVQLQEFLKKEDLSCHEWWYLASYIFSYPIFFVSEIMDIFDATALVAEQTHVLASKHLAQKRRGGRSTLKVRRCAA